MFENIVDEGNIVVIDNDWIVLCKRWKPWCHNLFCYLYLHKEDKNLMVGSHFTMTEDKKKSTRLATNEKIPTHCVKNWDSISPEMANYCINSPYYKAIPYTHVLFINGYRKDSPRIEKEIESITIGKPKKGLCPDKWLDTEFFIIKFK